MEKVTIAYRFSRHDDWSKRTVTQDELAAELLHLFENGAEICKDS